MVFRCNWVANALDHFARLCAVRLDKPFLLTLTALNPAEFVRLFVIFGSAAVPRLGPNITTGLSGLEDLMGYCYSRYCSSNSSAQRLACHTLCRAGGEFVDTALLEMWMIRIIIGKKQNSRQRKHPCALRGQRRREKHDFAIVGILQLSSGDITVTGLSVEKNLIFGSKLRKALRERVTELLKRVGLSDVRRKSVSSFSKGMRQRLLFAKALLMRIPNAYNSINWLNIVYSQSVSNQNSELMS
ncbi:ABC-type dipeptide/oligopeptide/nickel transport system ATPase subunit [Paenibacillus peoriae]|uniref:ABC-type dipeptide/oligopeptide/nickel transport system ATPase subunit n=1 Tax=Paenibacillus peoriae TaxID=59893 RepID=A0ABU1QNC2_9BACL|nr:ABC-type dipeptide/oligopeptide/nickel transport system ATPase subunit [Paenibacillus peoriae]